MSNTEHAHGELTAAIVARNTFYITGAGAFAFIAVVCLFILT